MLISYKTIGSNVRAARKALRLTQEQVADRLKMSQLHFGRLERGERPASLEQIAQIAQVLGVSLTSLLSGCAVNEDFSAPPQQSAQSLGESIAQLATGCSPHAQALMIALCQTVAENDKLSSSRK